MTLPRQPRSTALAAAAPTNRRTLLAAGLGLAAWLGAKPLRAAPERAAPKTLRIGYQKYGTLVLLKGRGDLDRALARQGVAVAWSEFPSGPPLLEALNAGAIDLGSAGETPPIFAQAASPELRYVAAEPPAPRGEAILVRRDSPIRTVADLRGKRVALNKGSNVHALLLRALEKAGVPYEAVDTAFLAPADGNAAFVRGAVDAWAIWDPYLAAAERATGARTLATAEGLTPNRQFYLASRTITETAPGLVAATLDAIGAIDAWARDNTASVAAELAPAIGIPAQVLAVALERQSYGVAPLDAGAIAEQQRIADSFHALKLIPKPVRIADAVWTPPAGRNG